MIQIKDQLHVFEDNQIRQLQDRSLAYGFDVKLLVSDGTLSRSGLENTVSSAVTGPRTVSIGIDPRHHFTFVRGSKDLGLPSGPEIASAGNSHFRTGNMVGGIDAIMARAQALRVESRVVTGQGAPVIVHEHPMSSAAWWTIGGIGAAVIACLCYLAWRSSRREAEAEAARAELRAKRAELNNAIGDAQIAKAERDEVASFDRRLKTVPPVSTPRYVPSSAPPAPLYTTPTYVPPPTAAAPVIINQTPQRDLLTDLLILDAVTDHHWTPEQVIEREVVVERDTSSSSWGSSDSSSSSSSSSWFDSSSSDSSSSSSWDSGGSSDWGGGGGGSDW